MRIYYHPASTTSRPLMLFAAEQQIPIDFKVVDLFTGEHYKEDYSAINPNHLVPVLEDGDFRLTESSAILKYLADKTKSPAYPTGLQARARVNERMDWINTQVCRDFAYGFVYPQIFPGHKRPSDEAQSATLAWGKERAKGWLGVLDQHLLGDNRYLCGSELTIADYFGAPFVALGEVVRCDYAGYPHVKRWLVDMKQLRSWRPVYEVFDGFAASLKDAKFVTL
jgi:glutathione S-transferase